MLLVEEFSNQDRSSGKKEENHEKEQERAYLAQSRCDAI